MRESLALRDNHPAWPLAYLGHRDTHPALLLAASLVELGVLLARKVRAPERQPEAPD